MQQKYKIIRIIRIVLAAIIFVCITLLFLDYTDSLHHYLSWLERIQFLPAILALNLVIVLALLLITFVFGRVYCSVICPMGILQDIIAWFGTRRKSKRNKYHFTEPKNLLRYTVLGIFVVLMVAGLNGIAILIAPYSAFGRIAQNLFAPIYQVGNNILAYFAERLDSYAFYSTEVWIRSMPTFFIALLTLIIIVVLAWRGGRTWCNTICPVGTVLGVASKFSLFRPRIDKSKCIHCRKCEKLCKAACINIDTLSVDTSRCVTCMNCMCVCKKDAVQYEFVPFWKKDIDAGVGSEQNGVKDEIDELKDEKEKNNIEDPKPEANGDDSSQSEEKESAKENEDKVKGSDISSARRGFLMAIPSLTMASAAFAQDKTTDGGLAELKPRKSPDRGEFPIKPPGSISLKHFTSHCTGCQLCVSQCPNGVLRPSASILTLMQPEMGFERGYCRPECNHCSEVCPTGAIVHVSHADKSSIQIGKAVWIRDLCVPVSSGDACGNCARHCPNGAIIMVDLNPSEDNLENDKDKKKEKKLRIPTIDVERCIGCGACEYVCPTRPISAIHVEGYEVHREI